MKQTYAAYNPYSIRAKAKAAGVKLATVYWRMQNKHMTLDEALVFKKVENK